MTTQALVAQLRSPPPFDLVEITGIESRHVRGPQEDTLSLSLAAARDCLANSRYAAADLDCVISCAITRRRNAVNYYLEPAMSLWIKNELGARRALHFDLSNACAGMLTGVYLLDSLIKSGVVKNGMVVSGECNTPISETAVKEIESVMDEQFASLTVGDAATAVILDAEPVGEEKLNCTELQTFSEHSGLCLGMPSTKNAGVSLYTKNVKLHNADTMRVWTDLVEHIEKKSGKSLRETEFDYFIPHQISTRFTQRAIRVCDKVLGWTLPEALHCLADCANTSSTSHFVVLYQALQQGLVGKGSKLLLIPAASGVVTGYTSITLGDLKVSA